MDWNNLAPIQLMALGAQTAICNSVSCGQCRIHEKRLSGRGYECHRWAIESPEEALKLYGVDKVDGDAALITLVDENSRLKKENADQIAATAEALGAKEALEVDLDELKVLCAQLQEENADLLKDRDSEDLELERVRNGNKGLSESNRKLNDDLSTMTRAYCEAKGRADGLLEALKIISRSQI